MPEPKRKWLFPHAAELEYIRLLKDYAARIIDKIRAVLHGWLQQPQHDRQWHQALSSLLDHLEFGAEQIDTLKGIAATAAAVNRFNDGQFHAVVKSAVGLDFVKAEPWLDDTLRGWINENTRLIKDVPTEHLKRIQAAVYQAHINGTDAATLAKTLAELDKMPITRAELIAADQIGKLNGQLARQRQQSIGVKQYRWRTMQDERVRDRHIRREGRVYRWDEPPTGGHPGSEIRCRCWAAMILPELEEMDAQFFGDGSNRNHYEQMRRRRLDPLPERTLPENPYARYQYVPRGTNELPEYIERTKQNAETEPVLTAKTVLINTEILGVWDNISELRKKVRDYAKDNLSGKTVVNAETGHEIIIGMTGIKHTIVRAHDYLLMTVPMTDQIIKAARLIETVSDKHDDPNIVGVERYHVLIDLNGEQKEVVVTVKHHLDGRRYYDHGFVKK